MMDFSHTYRPVGVRLRVSRALLILSAALAVALTVLVIVLVSGGSDSATQASSPVSYSSGAPNESLRGQAAATSAGATQVGGPDESARGASAASAVGH